MNTIREITVYIEVSNVDKQEYKPYFIKKVTYGSAKLKKDIRFEEQKGYFLTKEQMIELFQKLLDEAANKANFNVLDENDITRQASAFCDGDIAIRINKESITSILPEFIKTLIQ